jgi:hypothetical protein
VLDNAASLSIRLSTHRSLLQRQVKILKQGTEAKLSQKLASEGNVDPSNAAALLHVLNEGLTKDFTMC